MTALRPEELAGDEDRDVRIGGWRLVADVRELHGPEGEVRRIGPTALRVLQLLVEAGGAVVPKETLVEQAWAGEFVSDEALTSVVYELRRALGDDAREPRYIQTIPRTGFRMVATIERRAGPESPVEDRQSGASGSGPRTFGSLGDRESRRIVLLLVGLAIVLAVSGGLRIARMAGIVPDSGVPESNIRTLAVLPSEVLRQPDEMQLVGALSEMLTTELAQVCAAELVPGIVVREREEPWDLEGSREQLGADAVVEGSVLRYSDRVWVSLQLVDSRSGRLLWAASWDRPAADAAAVLREVALEAALELQAIVDAP